MWCRKKSIYFNPMFLFHDVFIPSWCHEGISLVSSQSWCYREARLCKGITIVRGMKMYSQILSFQTSCPALNVKSKYYAGGLTFTGNHRQGSRHQWTFFCYESGGVGSTKSGGGRRCCSDPSLLREGLWDGGGRHSVFELGDVMSHVSASCPASGTTNTVMSSPEPSHTTKKEQYNHR